MGFRTTIILDNDNLDILYQDQEIGRKIYQQVNGYMQHTDGEFGPLGHVVEQAHADVARLAIIKDFDVHELTSIHWGLTSGDPALELLKQAVDVLGYKLVKKPIPKEPIEQVGGVKK